MDILDNGGHALHMLLSNSPNPQKMLEIEDIVSFSLGGTTSLLRLQ